ncbi:MAG TPA: HAMP domain-containing sensor histidine kinase [Bacteroidales bacterium]|nr:HAMP domain-containing sensor histidine kinase [Bacteroidales bacterium]
MNRNLSTKFLLISTLIVFIAAAVADIIHNSNIKYRYEVSKVNRMIIRKEIKAAGYLEKIAEVKDDSVGLDNEMEEVIKEGNIIAAYYSDGILKAWSDNSFLLPAEYDTTLLKEPFIFLYNRWMILHKLEEENNVFVSLVVIRNDYNIKNEYIVPGYVKGLGLPEGSGFSLIENVGYPVYGESGEFLFSMTFDNKERIVTIIGIIPVLLWMIFIFLIVSLGNRLASFLTSRKNKLLSFLLFLILSSTIYLLFLFSDKPEVINHLGIFASDRFTLGSLIPSPGHMLIISLLFLYMAYGFHRYYPLPDQGGEKPGRDFACMVSCLIIGGLIFILFSWILSKFIAVSNINFEIHKIIDLDQFTLVAILSSSLFFVALGIYLLRVMYSCQRVSDRSIFIASGTAVIIMFLFFALRGKNPFAELVTFALMIAIARLVRGSRVSNLNISVLFAIVSAAYTSYILPTETKERETRNLEVMAINYCTDNDIYGESLLLDLWEEIKSDTLISSLMGLEYFSDEDVVNIYDYLDNKYFTDYWENYDMIYTVCNSRSPLRLENNPNLVNCFDFFRERSDSMGIPLADSNLVFLNNRSGRAYYLGSLYYKNTEGDTNGLFIELVNQVKYVQSGYPRLLLNEKYLIQPKLQEYSVAKYYSDTLVIQTGAFPFEPVMKYLNDPEREFVMFRIGGTDYLIYNHSPDIAMVITRPSILFTDHLVTFTYFFVLFFLLYFAFGLFIIPSRIVIFSGFDFRKKIQYAFIVLLLGSVVAIGTVVIILSINQYRGKHLDNIKEKLSSVFIELEHKLAQEESLSADWSGDGYESLDALLAKFSNVFKTDINLYTTDGNLLATSRREIFDKKLTSTRMDYLAFSRLAIRGGSEYIHEEQIGKLKFLSAYTLFMNERNEVLAFLNLPYFNVQSRLTEEVSNLVVTIVNFSLILIVIAMGIAVFISARITNPLSMLQEGLASVRLGKVSEPLEYKGKDEIGELVKQYNTMLQELHESALKLARTEREDAWREMAKQIAHEIKNPLTPMKLNVQQLFKSWENKEEDFEKRISRFSESQIEYINNLSSIATEFSNFARMPRANPSKTNLISHINSISELFMNISNINLMIDLNGLTEIMIYADKEQLNSMLTNILRNSVQAIPANRKGSIHISVEQSRGKALMKISDNGVGIPDNLKDKLFAPNFTTKSSGMGLGLAITKRIVETANGNIWFESKVNKGTTFFIEYPVLNII